MLTSLRGILASHANLETGKMPVRLSGVGPYSLDVEMDAYVKTTDYDEFIALRQQLLMDMLKALEKAGTALAVPVQENIQKES